VSLKDIPQLKRPEAEPRREPRAPSRLVMFLLKFTSVGVLLILIAYFSIAAHGFATVFSFTNLLNATAVFLLLALGETFVLFAGGIDLSVGSMLGLGGVASAIYMSAHSSGNSGVLVTFVGVLIACGVGAVGGAFNGAAIAYLNLSPLIVTLGSYGIFLGIADLLSNGLPIENLPGASFTLGNGTFWSIPYIAYIAFGIAIVLTFVAKNTRFGLYSYAIGTNREAVRRSGVNIKWHSVLLYGLCGSLAGLAGMLNAVHFSSASSSSGSSDLLVAIAAVVIGGTPITGGEGKVWGTVIGALIYTILQNGFVLMNVASFWQLIVIGFLIMLVVSLDNYQRRLHAMTRISKELESISPDAQPSSPITTSEGAAVE